jgi:hypothetical protein
MLWVEGEMWLTWNAESDVNASSSPAMRLQPRTMVRYLYIVSMTHAHFLISHTLPCHLLDDLIGTQEPEQQPSGRLARILSLVGWKVLH